MIENDVALFEEVWAGPTLPLLRILKLQSKPGSTLILSMPLLPERWLVSSRWAGIDEQ
jgi:hypothetical protein